MPRVISFLVLVGVLLIAGAVFFQVMAPFLVPMFVAAVLVVVFKPLHLWVFEHVNHRPRLAAVITTALILLTVLVPTTWLGWKAYQQSAGVIEYVQKPENRTAMVEQIKSRAADFTSFYERTFNAPLNIDEVFNKITSTLGGKAVSGVQAAGKLIFGVLIMILSLYYFLADGRLFVQTILRLSPLDPEYEQELLNRFAMVSRAVVTASLVTAVAQGLLAGAGFYLAMNKGAPIFLLMAATMILAVVPFLGGASVWIPTCIWIYLFQETTVNGAIHKGDTVSAIALAIYCGLVVSTVDNFIKPWVLHGQSNLHPLLAFLSILGGIAALGPVGILVGPMMVAFVQALLVMVNKELALMQTEAEAIESLAAHGPPELVVATVSPQAASALAAGAESVDDASKKTAKFRLASKRPKTPPATKRRRGRK